MTRLNPKDLNRPASVEPDPVDNEESPGSIELGMAMTINIGNYQSVKINLSIDEPYTGAPGDTRDDKYTLIRKWMIKKLQGDTPDLLEEARETIAEAKYIIRSKPKQEEEDT